MPICAFVFYFAATTGFPFIPLRTQGLTCRQKQTHTHTHRDPDRHAHKGNCVFCVCGEFAPQLIKGEGAGHGNSSPTEPLSPPWVPPAAAASDRGAPFPSPGSCWAVFLFLSLSLSPASSSRRRARLCPGCGGARATWAAGGGGAANVSQQASAFKAACASSIRYQGQQKVARSVRKRHWRSVLLGGQAGRQRRKTRYAEPREERGTWLQWSLLGHPVELNESYFK